MRPAVLASPVKKTSRFPPVNVSANAFAASKSLRPHPWARLLKLSPETWASFCASQRAASSGSALDQTATSA